MFSLRCTAAAALALGLLTACTEQSPLGPLKPDGRAVSREIATSSLVWRDQITGVTADGAQYGLFVPNNWNGDAVFYAHGIIAPLLPVGLPSPIADWDKAETLRDALGEAGYAVAYSSFNENGYAIKSGIQRTHQLRGLFTSKFGKPTHSFLIGHSLGAQVVQALAETYPTQYNGALAMCGVLGGTRLQVDYVGHTRAMFDFFYPGVLPGNVMEMPVVITDPVQQIQLPVLKAVTANPTGLGLIAASTQVQLAGNNPTELITSLVNALTYHAIGVNDLLARTHEHFLFDNSTTQYGSPLYPAAYYQQLNEGITRYTATPDALAWLEQNYEPTGDLRIPMLTLHKTRDRLVPYRHEAAYKKRVDAAGASANLVQRSDDAFGHCEFAAADVLNNFQELVRWANGGARP